MEKAELYIKKYHIELSDVDFTQSLKLSSLFNYLQDIASEAVDMLGMGINTLVAELGVSWVLIRLRTEIFRNPKWGEVITIETWHQEPGRLEFARDFLVKDAEGIVIAAAVSSWVIVDVITREVRKTDILPYKKASNVKSRAINCKLGKLKSFGESQFVYKKAIGYSDIDFNGHINNSRYVDYIMDCFTVENHKLFGVKSLEINYLNEVLPGDNIILNRDISALNSNLLYIEGKSENHNKIVFKSQIEIEANK